MFVADRFLSVRFDPDSWKAFSFYGWWYLVSTGLSVPKTRTSHPFLFGEKPDRKDNAVQKRQN